MVAVLETLLREEVGGAEAAEEAGAPVGREERGRRWRAVVVVDDDEADEEGCRGGGGAVEGRVLRFEGGGGMSRRSRASWALRWGFGSRLSSSKGSSDSWDC